MPCGTSAWHGQSNAPKQSGGRVYYRVVSYALIHLSGYYHVFGTDKVGEDVFYQAVKSIRTGLVIGTLTTLIMLPMAIIFGILAGFFRGWVDDVIQYVYTTLNSIPGVLLIAASILMVQVYMANHEAAFTSVIVRADMRLLFLCMILGVTSWTGLCRLLRAETLKLREMEYVQAASSLGRQARRDFAAPHPAQCDAYRADLRGAGFQFAGAGRSGVVVYQYRRRSDQLQLGQYD